MSDFYSSQELEQLAQRGVRILLPEQTAIRRDVDLQQLESGAVLHPGTRLQGQSTRILAGAEIGPGGYVVLEDSVICLLYTSPSPRDLSTSRMPSSA